MKITCQVFGNKKLFEEAYPIKKKSDWHQGLDKFVKEYGAPENMNYDGEQEKSEERQNSKEWWENMKSKGTSPKQNSQTKIQWKVAYNNYDGDGIILCSGRIACSY